jgi:hypothetical protein
VGSSQIVAGARLSKHNQRRLTTLEHAKELEQPPLVWSDRPVSDELSVVSLLGFLGRVFSVK